MSVDPFGRRRCHGQHRRHLALVGSTASGKSAVALEMARRIDGVELVSVDSMSVYRGMDIGTAKPSRQDRAEVPHHLLDLADPDERFTVTRFAAAAAVALAGIEARGHTAILVGGTGLYLQAVLGDIEPPGEWPDLRAELEAEIDDHPQGPEAGSARLHRRLAQADPIASARMTPTNRRRVARALEVTIGSGRPFSSFGAGIGAYPPIPFALIGVWLPRDVVAARIAERVTAMVEAGLVAEVGALLDRPGGLGPTARQALGYREVLSHLEQGADLASVLELTRVRTQGFAVRQRRWFRRDPRIRWYGTENNPVALVPALLRELERCRS
jgi:tRNA dimethylallyltransferase